MHNPRCSKSRQTLQLLREHGHEPTIIEYLETPPDEARLRDLLAKLELTPLEIIRTGEAAFTAARDAVRAMSSDAQLSWLAQNSEVLRRPITIREPIPNEYDASKVQNVAGVGFVVPPGDTGTDDEGIA